MRMRTAVIQALVLCTLIPVAAGVSARRVEAAVAGASTTSSCAQCTSSISQIADNKWGASWANVGPCVAGSPCAVCDPGCSVSETIVGTFDQVSKWYDWNRCENWGCWEMLPLPVSEIQGASVADLETLVTRFDRTVKWNAERSSIQLYDCQGLVAANLPLPSAVAGQLAERLAAAGL